MANGYGSSSSSTQSTTQGSVSSVARSGIGVSQQISSLTIDTSDMPTAITSRVFSVTGGKNAKFKIIALQNPSSSSTHTLYYDWKSQAFESGHNDVNNDLVVSLSGGTYTNNINFPSGGGEFVIKLIPLNGTKIRNSRGGIITKTISKASANTTLTFAPRSTTSNYATQPTMQSTGTVDSVNIAEFNWDVENISNDTHGFGLRLTGLYRSINENAFYFETTEDVVQNTVADGADSTRITVTSTANLSIGMELIYYKGTTAPENNAGSAVGTTTITKIGTEANSAGKFEITFSQRVGFDEGETMTFRAYGSTMEDAIGLDMSFQGGFVAVSPTILTKTVRTDASSDTINLNGTYGIAGGNLIKYTGVGVNNSSANAVTSVSASSTAGSITVQLAQTLSAGTVLTFPGCHKIINFTGSFRIFKYPTANQNIYLDLDKFITVGAGS